MATDGNVTISDGVLKNRHFSSSAAIARSKLAQRVLSVTGVPLTALKVTGALQTNLTASASGSDLGLTTGTYGSGPPYVASGDLKAAGATSRKAVFYCALPPEYEAAETVNLRAYAGMVTTVSDTTATVLFECWRIDKEDGTLGSANLVSTSATTINSLTAAAKDFVVTATTLLPGDQLYCRLTLAINDAASATAVIGAVYAIELLADLR